LLEEFARQGQSLAPANPPPPATVAAEEEKQTGSGGLTDHQAEILRLVASGLTYNEVAEQLSISERTVRYQMTKIMDRLHLYNRAQVLAYAGKMGLKPPG
jgi:DNA-binding NarL/FixJ family response regulator